MILKKPALPPGWYPQSPEEINRFLTNLPPGKRDAAAVIAPHAGWFFSGALSAAAVAALQFDAEMVAIIGGHLPEGYPPLMAEEEGALTPLGPMMMDREVQSSLAQAIGTRPDGYADNTVEVLLPMVKFFFPNARLVWLRLPPGEASFRAGRLLAEICRDVGRNIVVLGSTDLTHYGDNYGFSPQGRGKKALDWVKNVNDKRFIDTLLAGAPSFELAREVLRRAQEDSSSCSAGAVAGCLGFLVSRGSGAGELLGYSSSADILEDEESPSFVGYGAFAWRAGLPPPAVP